jgi:hypothetical protein
MTTDDQSRFTEHWSLSLALLVPGICADNPHHTVALDDFAVLAPSLD